MNKQITISSFDVDLEKSITMTLERLLEPVVDVVCKMEQIRRKEYLTEKEAALLFSLSAATLRTQRSRGRGPHFIKINGRILYAPEDIKSYLRGK